MQVFEWLLTIKILGHDQIAFVGYSDLSRGIGDESRLCTDASARVYSARHKDIGRYDHVEETSPAGK